MEFSRACAAGRHFRAIHDCAPATFSGVNVAVLLQFRKNAARNASSRDLPIANEHNHRHGELSARQWIVISVGGWSCGNGHRNISCACKSAMALARTQYDERLAPLAG